VGAVCCTQRRAGDVQAQAPTAPAYSQHLLLLLLLQTPYIKLSENSWAVRLSRGCLAFTYDI
jgi:hypothetical protein